MSAQLLELDPQLQQAVNNQVISVAQAWAFQDLVESVPDGQIVEAPEEWLPWLDRLQLWQAPTANRLPA
jgi:hypothetical protein